MLEAGARGYLTKNSGQAEIIRAIKTVAAGQIYIETDIASRLTQNNLEDSKSAANAATVKRLKPRLIGSQHVNLT